MIEAPTLHLRVADVTGQKRLNVKNVPRDATIGELIDGLLPRMNMPRNDNGGRALNYQARLDRDGRHLFSSEVVGDALQADDHLVLQPEIHAGAA
jgi:hypothetical protein